jgi:hypothetical protein
MIVSKLVLAKIVTASVIASASIGYVIFSPPMGNIEGLSMKKDAPTSLSMQMFTRSSSIEEYERDYGEAVSLTGTGFSQAHVGEE